MIKTWGTFGDPRNKLDEDRIIIFQHLTSPVYGSVSTKRKANYTEHKRIITRDATGALHGQKPLRQKSSLDLVTWDFSFKISSMILFALSTDMKDRALQSVGAGRALGTAVGSRIANKFNLSIGETEEDKRFYSDIDSFKTKLESLLDSQEPFLYFVGEKLKGYFTLDDLSMDEKHRPDGSIKVLEGDILLTEWITE